MQCWNFTLVITKSVTSMLWFPKLRQNLCCITLRDGVYLMWTFVRGENYRCHQVKTTKQVKPLILTLEIIKLLQPAVSWVPFDVEGNNKNQMTKLMHWILYSSFLHQHSQAVIYWTHSFVRKNYYFYWCLYHARTRTAFHIILLAH